VSTRLKRGRVADAVIEAVAALLVRSQMHRG
jgi:hypothetical protein